jgi:hypothetical protein
MKDMARGWESKSVEEQISQKENPSNKPRNSRLTREQAAIGEKRASLILARTRTLSDLESVRDDRYRALLKRTLAHLESELVELDRK